MLGAKYGIEEWEASSFEVLCQRPKPLEDEEAEKLGVLIVAKLSRERETRLRSGMAGGQAEGSLQTSVGPTNPPRGPTATSDPLPGPPKTSQSTTSATTDTKPVVSSTNVASTSPDDTAVKPNPPKVKLEPLEEQNVFAYPQPTPNQPNSGRSINIGNPFPPAPPSFPPPVSGKAPQKSAPSEPTPATPQSQGYSLFNGVSTSDPPFAVKPVEAQKNLGESALPASASQSKFTFGQ